jgi:hypothetical protein
VITKEPFFPASGHKIVSVLPAAALKSDATSVLLENQPESVAASFSSSLMGLGVVSCIATTDR